MRRWLPVMAHIPERLGKVPKFTLAKSQTRKPDIYVRIEAGHPGGGAGRPKSKTLKLMFWQLMFAIRPCN
jgi:hypothetical protein